MRASKPVHRAKSAEVTRQPFDWPSFNVPYVLTHRVTIALVVLTMLLAGVAWWGQQSLTDRQIAGGERVLQSLATESKVLEQRWREGGFPARSLEAEQSHIDDESEQQESQLAELRQSHG
jgi:hypothetical protein